MLISAKMWNERYLNIAGSVISRETLPKFRSSRRNTGHHQKRKKKNFEPFLCNSEVPGSFEQHIGNPSRRKLRNFEKVLFSAVLFGGGRVVRVVFLKVHMFRYGLSVPSVISPELHLPNPRYDAYARTSTMTLPTATPTISGILLLFIPLITPLWAYSQAIKQSIEAMIGKLESWHLE
ncbi:predicted protein [Sclerotinia sclerotiorum 1980 UF-70]|uniref:Uncharacterized protein n=1 Tax=Sclerotinia sclerotiorum (strain ATCC 18683 / 1980 / Ss-1) TaxID=665079 RepID=A7EYK5_SCLS1|nr:predicted protein [Sclerotinia sclerotiorum 1980 UF-70]EDN94547.1 predicted protein [Sclerotinia sclerotiorum 1980 UF-70]